jgi:hypothetical protein
LGSLTCSSAYESRWHHGCYGWRVKFKTRTKGR